ncbi:hypothetical protein H6G00_24660 [Leptolyngbya sp. FACHB-541]|uniref:hypothetical protein n=1 Tax=Leptolyngbya sp. FACHB-541 TaxID=2692810 RepID=UPI0016872DE9|nr:hypothetical protein [Leptolyngbya sp. FACHB-541]MBD1999766.1 hypothetical protein [Leptolyngbya sp. FACHB-541]
MDAEHESMDSESEAVSELSSDQPSQIRLIGWSQKAKDIGAGVYGCDPYVLPLNPALSSILTTQPTVVRNEVTLCLLSVH